VKHADQVPRPDFWADIRGSRSFEFWQGQSDRLHDRIRFRRLLSNEVVDGKMSKLGEDGWVMERLQP